MNIIATIQNVIVVGAMLTCILTGHAWWALAFLFLGLIPKNKD